MFFLHSTKFQYFFYGFKSQSSNSYDNWYVQKYLKRIFHKGMLLIWKEYFTCAILSFSSPKCAIIASLNVIYTKFRRAMIAQLNKLWRVGVCLCDRTPLTPRPDLALEIEFSHHVKTFWDMVVPYYPLSTKNHKSRSAIKKIASIFWGKLCFKSCKIVQG